MTLLPAELVFDWLLKDNPELARAMGKAGATVYLHKLAGYEVVSKPVTPVSYLDALKALVAVEEEKSNIL